MAEAEALTGGGKRLRPSEPVSEVAPGEGERVAPHIVQHRLLEPSRGTADIGLSTENISQVGKMHALS